MSDREAESTDEASTAHTETGTYDETVAQARKAAWLRIRFWSIVILLGLALIAGLVGAYLPYRYDVEYRNCDGVGFDDCSIDALNQKWETISIVACLIGVAVFGAWGLVNWYILIERRRQALSIDVSGSPGKKPKPETRSDDASAKGGLVDLELAALWGENRERLEKYHGLVTDYASSTRLATIVTIVTGFVFIIIIGLVGALSSGVPGAISSSVIAASGAILTGFIGKAVIENSANSSKELLSFFSHPIEVERALRAERLVEQIEDPDKKASAQLALIEYLADCPRPDSSETGSETQTP